jgi:hypothetical protein
MDMGFVVWWFDKHSFWSTVLTPGMTLAWCFYKGLVWRGIVAGFLTAAFLGSRCWSGDRCGKEGAAKEA